MKANVSPAMAAEKRGLAQKSRTHRLLGPHKQAEGWNVLALSNGRWKLPDDQFGTFLEHYVADPSPKQSPHSFTASSSSQTIAQALSWSLPPPRTDPAATSQSPLLLHSHFCQNTVTSAKIRSLLPPRHLVTIPPIHIKPHKVLIMPHLPAL